MDRFLSRIRVHDQIQTSSFNQIAEYLFRFGRCEPALDRTDEGEFAMIVAEEEQGLNAYLKEVQDYLLGAIARRTNCEIWLEVEKMAKLFLV